MSREAATHAHRPLNPRLEAAYALSLLIYHSCAAQHSAATAVANDGQNQISIRFSHDSNRGDDSILTLHNSIRIVYDSILIRCRIFIDLIQDMRNFSKSRHIRDK